MELGVPSRTEAEGGVLVSLLLWTFNCLVTFYYQHYSSIYRAHSRSWPNCLGSTKTPVPSYEAEKRHNLSQS